jgi:hypothetical protein
MREISFRNWVAFLAVVLVLALLSTLGCKKETPGPSPEPTPVVEPTAVANADAPVCIVKVPQGTPGGDICKNADGATVACPVDTSGLPACGD